VAEFSGLDARKVDVILEDDVKVLDYMKAIRRLRLRS
jgi:hypothetical protein